MEQRQSAPLPFSDIDLLGQRARIINIDTGITNSIFVLGVAEQELVGAHVAASPVNQYGLGWPERVGAEQRGVQPDARDPIRYKSRLLTGRRASNRIVTACKGIRPSLLFQCSQVGPCRLPVLLGDPGTDRSAGFLLPVGCPTDVLRPGAISSARKLTTSRPRDLQSIAKLNNARSRILFAS